MTRDPSAGEAEIVQEPFMSRATTKVGTVTVRGDRVSLSRAEYDRLRAKAGEADVNMPDFPRPNADGNYPAVEALRVSIARTLIRRRREAGLSQAELAERAGVRQETISRIESGKHTATEQTLAKVERALDRMLARTTKKR